MKKKQYHSPPRRVALFATCMVDMMYPEVGMATVELLERHGIEVIFPMEQTCCGQPAFNAGFRNETRQLAERFIEIFEPLVRLGEIEAIVVPSGSCATMTSHFYPTLFEGGASKEILRKAELLSSVTFELTEFLVDVLGVTHTNSRLPAKVAYHACCHLLRELHVDEQPRTLLNNVTDLEVIELEESDECCGFGGLFAVKNAGISTAMGDRKVVDVMKSGADMVAMCDVSCMTHINGLMDKAGGQSRAVHIAEVLNAQVSITVKDAGAMPESSASLSQKKVKEEKVVQKPRRWQE